MRRSANGIARSSARGPPTPLGGIPGTWRPVYPTPEDWYDLTQRDRFKDVEIDLTGDAPSGGGFITLPGSDEPERLKWRTPQGPVQVDDNGLRTLPVSSPRLVPNRVLQLAQAHVARPTLTPFKMPPCKATAHEHATVPNRTSTPRMFSKQAGSSGDGTSYLSYGKSFPKSKGLSKGP
jgi:hypothetical protein